MKRLGTPSQANKAYTHLLALLLLLAIVLVVYWNDVQYFFNVPKPVARIYVDDFRDGGERFHAEAKTIQGDWLFRPNLVMLQRGGAGTIRFVNDNSPQSNPYLRLWMTKSPHIRARLRVRSDANERVYDSRWLDGQEIRIGSLTRGHRSYSITFEARATEGAPSAAVPVLTRIELCAYRNEADRMIAFPSLAALLVVPCLIYFLGSVARLGTMTNGILTSLIAIVLLVLGKVVPGVFRYNVFIAYGLLLLCWVVAALSGQYGKRRAHLATLTALIVTLYGFSLRWQPLIEKLGYIIDPDAEDFFHIATTAHGFFNSSFSTPPYIREPFFAWLIKALFLAVPATRESLRLLTVLSSTATIFLGYIFARTLFSRRADENVRATYRLVVHDLAAPGVALFLAANPFLISMSNRGLRFELWVLLILTFLMCLRGWDKRRATGALAVGVVAGANHLLRITTLSYTMPLIVVFGLWNKAKWHQVVMALAVSLLLLAPHLVFNYSHSDSRDFFYTSNVHARYYRDKEFAGTPGFPTVEEVRKNAWAGAPITTFEYVFGLHTFGDVVRRSLRGFVRIFFTAYSRDELFATSLVLYAAYLLGLAVLPFTRHRWLIGALLVLELPAYFLAGTSLDPRLVLHIAPLQGAIMILGFLAVAYGIELAARIVQIYRSARAASQARESP